MPFPQEQVAWLLANRAKLFRYAFIPQLLVALLFLGFAYRTGRVHSHLLFHGIRTQGTITGFRPVLFRKGSSASSGFSQTVYMPIVEFRAGDRFIHIEEWKASNSDGSVGSLTPVLYDPDDVSFAMMDRGTLNWLPWGPCFAIGLLLSLAALKGFFSCLFRRDPAPN